MATTLLNDLAELKKSNERIAKFNKLGLYLAMMFQWLQVECISIEINMQKKLE